MIGTSKNQSTSSTSQNGRPSTHFTASFTKPVAQGQVVQLPHKEVTNFLKRNGLSQNSGNVKTNTLDEWVISTQSGSYNFHLSLILAGEWVKSLHLTLRDESTGTKNNVLYWHYHVVKNNNQVRVGREDDNISGQGAERTMWTATWNNQAIINDNIITSLENHLNNVLIGQYGFAIQTSGSYLHLSKKK